MLRKLLLLLLITLSIKTSWAKAPLQVPLHFETRPTGFMAQAQGYRALVSAQGIQLAINAAPLRIELVDSKGAGPVAQKKLPGKSYYRLGIKKQDWYEKAHYGQLVQPDVYAGIDLVYYPQGQRLAFDLHLQPRANPKQIQWAYQGAERLSLSPEGDLLIQTPGGVVRQTRPIAYQVRQGKQRFVPARYRIRGNQVGVHLGRYDRSMPLVIDPTLELGTSVGGSGGERGLGIAVDSAGNTYIAGQTSSLDFPVVTPAQPTNGGGVDAFVAKLDPLGAVIWATYVGGTDFDVAYGLRVDPSGSVYVTGETSSLDFPVVNSLQSYGGDTDGFVIKLSPDGSELMYGTYLGGSNVDLGLALGIDPDGAAYVTGATISTDFPLVTPLQANPGGNFDLFITKITPDGSALAYSTYWGGSNDDFGNGIAVDATGAYVTGDTSSEDFPLQAPLQAVKGTQNDAFITKIDPAGAAVVYSTYLGATGFDFAESIAVDSLGNAYITGGTDALDFPLANPLQTTNGGFNDAFVAKLDPTGSALVYSSYVGGDGVDIAYGVAVDLFGGCYIVGETTSTNFPVLEAIQSTQGSELLRDGFITKIDPNGASFSYSSYLGGTGEDQALAVAADNAGIAYLTGVTSSVDFPGTVVAGDAFVAVISAPSLGLVVDPASQTLALGSQGVFNLLLNRVDSSGSVKFSVLDLPPGSQALLDPAQTSENTSQLTILAPNNTQTGTFAVTIVAQSVEISDLAILTLTISPPSAVTDLGDQVTITQGGLINTTRIRQQVTITNTTGAVLEGPLYVALADLTPGVTVTTPLAGGESAGIPLIKILNLDETLEIDAARTITVELENPTPEQISYTPKLVDQGLTEVLATFTLGGTVKVTQNRQAVTITTLGATLTGPFYLSVEGLTPGATLLNATTVTPDTAAPAIGFLPTTLETNLAVVLAFENPTPSPLNFTLRFLR